jgi:hypothetical protein
MEWFTSLLSPEAPAGTTLRTLALSERGVLPLGVAATILVVAALVIAALYHRDRQLAGRLRVALMFACRLTAVALVVLLLVRPVLVAEFVGERPRGIVLLVDDTQSMTRRDPQPTPAATETAPTASVEDAAQQPSRAERVQAVLSNPDLQFLQRLAEVGPVQGFQFGEALRGGATLPTAVKGVSSDAADLARLRAALATRNADAHTRLADVIAELLAEREGDLPAALVVVTDGRDNASRANLADVARQCGQLEVPLHIFGAGSSTLGNLQLLDVAAPDTIFFDDTVQAEVRWRCHGLTTGETEITLRLGNQVVARKSVAVRDGDDLRETLSFVPRGGDQADLEQQLSATIRYTGREPFTDDNTASRPVRLVNARVRVLYIEGTPRWEFKFLQNALLRDRRVQAEFVLTEGDSRATGDTPYLPQFPATRQELFTYDVLMVGDVAPQTLTAERQAWLADFIAEGGGLVVLCGRQHLPAEYREAQLAELLPAEFPAAAIGGDSIARTSAFVPVLSPAGVRSDLLSLADAPEENQRVWRSLPGLFWHFPITKLRPGATALLTHPTQRAGGELMPLIATQPYGKGQVLLVASDETWRWRFNEGDKYFARFWGQAVYQTGLNHVLGHPRRVQLALERPENLLGRPSTVYARLFDADFRPLVKSQVTAHLKPLANSASSRPVRFEAVPGQPGEYRALLPNDQTGRFALTLDEEPATLEYRVDLPPRHEMEIVGMAEPALRQAALVSSGRFYQETDVHELPAAIVPRTAPLVHRREVLPWNALVFILFAAAVTIEWLLRKWSNLS